jgi:hypothetical protein
VASVARKAKQTSSNKPADPVALSTAVTDQSHALLVQGADEFIDRTANSSEERQL